MFNFSELCSKIFTVAVDFAGIRYFLQGKCG